MQRVVLLSAAAAALLASAPARSAPCAGFSDVEDTSAFCTSVAWMKNRAITLGCASDGSMYCPADFVRRDQMAAFLYRMGFHNAFLNGGSNFGATAVLGTRDNFALYVRADDRTVMRYLPTIDSPNLLGGHAINSVRAGVRGAAIGGGGQPGLFVFDPDEPNRVLGHFGTVAGGSGNTAGKEFNGMHASVGGGLFNMADGEGATVGGGIENTAADFHSTVSGGSGNEAVGSGSTVAGGIQNVASGNSSTVAGGAGNRAESTASFAAGVNAHAVHSYSFVWNGSPGHVTSSMASGDFVIYAPGRIRLFAGAYGSGGCEVGTGDVGANLTCQGVVAATSFVPTSDRALKSDILPVDPSAVLARVVALPIAEWSYTVTPHVRHMGPMGQDFHAAFGLGATEKGIATVDADGVAFAAIQGLYAKLESSIAARDARIAALSRELTDLREFHRKELLKLRQSIESLVVRTSEQVREMRAR